MGVKFLRQFLSMVFLRFPVYALAMKTHLLCVSAFALLLTGCSQFEELTSFPRVTREEPVAANNPEPMIAVPTSDDWCVRVAAGALAQAVQDGFDAATQQRRAGVAQAQCLRLRGS